MYYKQTFYVTGTFYFLSTFYRCEKEILKGIELFALDCPLNVRRRYT